MWGLLARPVVLLLVLGLGGAGMRYWVDHIQRLDASSMPYIEDSKYGNGTRYRVLQRAADTAGAASAVELLVRSGAPGFYAGHSGSCPAHVHQGSDEVLAVVAGVAGYRLTPPGGGPPVTGRLGAGETLRIPKGSAHWIANADNATDLLLELRHEPAGPLGEAWWETLAALGQEAGSIDRVHPLQVMLLYWEGDAAMSDLPGPLRPAVEHVMLPLARLLGFKATYPSHRSAAGATTAAAAAAATDDMGSQPEPTLQDDGGSQQQDAAHEEL